MYVFVLLCILTAEALRSSRSGCTYDPQPCSKSELYELGKKIWREDANRVSAGSGYYLNLQSNTGRDGSDSAPQPLFSRVDSSILQKPTIKAMLALFDNYYRDVGSPEDETSSERTENWNFINSMCNTRPVELVYQFLLRKKIVCSLRNFKSKLYHIWFELYPRRRGSIGSDSSGFEHVFVGETDSSKTLGFHNWIQFYLQEKEGNFNYKRYIGDLKQSNVITCQFTWHDKFKKIGGALVGTSPEFDFAIFSLTFLTKVREPVFLFGTDRVKVKCYGIRGGKIGTCYPILL